jgi:hypothetical protein
MRVELHVGWFDAKLPSSRLNMAIQQTATQDNPIALLHWMYSIPVTIIEHNTTLCREL